MTLKKFFKARVLILFFLIFLSLLWINPGETNGVLITDVASNSSAFEAGLDVDTSLKPKDRERIISIDDQEINNLDDFQDVIASLQQNSTFRIQTTKSEYPIYLNKEIGITVTEPPTSNIVKGLDLTGGTRVVLTPTEQVSEQNFPELINILEKRLNGFGFKDVAVKGSGGQYIIVEIAGASKSEVQELVSQQGKFEAKIGEDTVFTGGKKDVVFVCKDDGVCSGIRDCQDDGGNYQCVFEFQIGLSEEAAKKHAEVTSVLDVNITPFGQEYLSKPLELFLDDNLMDTLQISVNLKGIETKDILISGPGAGLTRDEAIQDAVKNMNNLQTILITGSLPVKLEIVRIDEVSPILGSIFVKEAILAGALALLMVAIVIFIRYRKLKISIPMVLISSSEVLILLGFAAATGYNFDLAAIVGIIAAVGTGVDDLIVITDETMKNSTSNYDWKLKIKRAFFVIMVAYFTTIAAMLPLMWAGAGLLTGFAIVTIAGVTIGVFITRPAYASIIEYLVKDKEES
jgi:preprotein translocase subunit SecD